MERQLAFNGSPYILSMEKTRNRNPFFHPKTIEIVFAIDGNISVNIEESTHYIKPGDFILINAGLTHFIECEKEVLIASIFIDLTYYESVYPHIHCQSLYCKYNEEKQYDSDIYKVIRNYFIRLVYIECLNIPKTVDMSKEICDIFMDILLNYLYDEEYLKQSIYQLKDVERKRVLDIAQFLIDHYNEQGISLEDLAAQVNLSTTRLSHFWKQMTNISITDSISMHRFYTSKRMLTSTELPINEISTLSGYSDEKYMYKAYKEKYGMTPNEYRKQHIKLHERKEKFKEIDVTKLLNVLIGYADKYYYCIKDFSYLDEKHKVSEEQRLNFIYDVFATMEKRKQDGVIENSKIAVTYLGLGAGLRLVDGKISINWEYIYAIERLSHIHMGMCGVTIDIRLMSPEEWVELFKNIITEIKVNTGEDFTENIFILIQNSGHIKSDEAVRLAEMLECEELFHQAMPIFSFIEN